jgi:hypothetical protein
VDVPYAPLTVVKIQNNIYTDVLVTFFSSVNFSRSNTTAAAGTFSGPPQLSPRLSLQAWAGEPLQASDRKTNKKNKTKNKKKKKKKKPNQKYKLNPDTEKEKEGEEEEHEKLVPKYPCLCCPGCPRRPKSAGPTRIGWRWRRIAHYLMAFWAVFCCFIILTYGLKFDSEVREDEEVAAQLSGLNITSINRTGTETIYYTDQYVYEYYNEEDTGTGNSTGVDLGT